MSALVYILTAILALLLFIRRSPKTKGYIGEKTVAYRLSKLSRGTYFVLHDVLVPSVRGTAQIDHVVVSVYGIFVIETKHYNGWIYGQERSEYWTQLLYGRKEQLYNPLRQNYGHVAALKGLLGEVANAVPWIPIVCFSGGAELEVETTSEVVTAKQLLRTIKSYNEQMLNRYEAQALFERLQQAKLIGAGVRRRHVRTVERQMEARTRDVSRGLCPRCGGELTRRKGKYGPFLGCANFPRCRFVHRERKSE